MNKNVICEMQERIIHNVRELNKHVTAATGELKEAVHGLAEAARKEDD